VPGVKMRKVYRGCRCGNQNTTIWKTWA